MTSSTEVECKGLIEVAKENVWQRQLQQELCLYKNYSPTKIFEDNTSCIYLINQKGTPHKRVKFFEIDWSYVKESAELGEIAVEYVQSSLQRADFLTKPLPVPKFIEHRDFVMGKRNDTF